MTPKQLLNCLLTITILLCALTNVRAQEQDTAEANATGENVVLKWNRVLQETLRTPGQQPATIRIQRSYAMMHLAMFDAINSIDGEHTPYLTDVTDSQQTSQEAPSSPNLKDRLRPKSSGRASPEAAAAQAAHDVLVALYPTRQVVFDAELANSLIGIPSKRAQQGVRVGRIIAERLVAHRAGDGWNATPPPYVLPTSPGNWQPTPPANAAATFTHFPAVLPFILVQNTQFLPTPPHALSRAEYAEELNEIKSLGSATSTTRTAEQTLTAQLWASGAVTEVLLNNLVRNLALNRNLSTAQNARLFALYYATIHDALQTTNTTQYTYGRWRPITAIRRADEDDNPNTDADPNWTSLINAPATPTYSSNASSLTSSAATALELFFGRDDIEFQINFGGTPNVIRTYRSFSAMTNEAARSRVFAGIHFQSDITAGQSAGRNVANYAFQNYLRPRCNR
ncbi:MAG: vanadium-dependent haloperoxidase [Pyrinomonadaceae bacterium MAG19_C2-C3]|nr:vanadium-dependent haloperoxidase [Pyrinomonadaceae bacterium MAG19_C2-C3]